MILNDIESKGLIQFNKEYHDEEFFKNFIQFKKAFSHSMGELINKSDMFQTKQSEMNIFTMYLELSYINSHLDTIKKFLKIIINPIKLEDGFGKNTTLEQMITQQQYRIYKSGQIVIYPNNEKMKEYLNIKDLADISIQSTEILDAMLDWSNGKTKSATKKQEGLDEIVGDLTKQVQALDKRLDKLS
jgi:hypothetical protein